MRPGLFVFILGCASLAVGVTPPASVLNLDAWKLTLPYDSERSGSPDEVVQPELNQFQDDRSFFVGPSGDAVIFRASCDGLGTENSDYPRSELRQMDPSGEDEASWSTTDRQRHELEAELAVTQTPKRKQHVVCAQIHGRDDDVLMVRLEEDELFIEREGADEIDLDDDYHLGEKFRLRIVAGGGSIRLWYNDQLKMDWKVEKHDCYFKLGCYTQSNRKVERAPGSYGEVAVYRLTLRQQGD